MIVLDKELRRLCHESTGDCCRMLSPRQWAMMELFSTNNNRITTHQELVEYVYSDAEQFDGITPTAVSSLTYRLRKRISEISQRKHILSAPAYGYRYCSSGRD